MKTPECVTSEPPVYSQHPDLALSAVLYLMSRFPATQSPAVARSIIEHLAVVSGDVRQSECVRETAAGLAEAWQGYARLAEPRAATGSVIGLWN